MDKLNGKVAIVTGASRGIGKAIAKELGLCGATIIINYSKDKEGAADTLRELNSLGITCSLIQSNVCNYEGCEIIVNEAIKTYGRLDILVNNAAQSTVGLFMDSSKEEIEGIIGVNLLGPMYLSKIALPYLIKRSGVILNISSMWGEVGASCEVNYSSSKGGLNLFTKALAKEMALSNVRVNAIAPGVINTKMNSFLSEEDKVSLTEEIPMGRFGSPEEIGKIAVFLCSNDSSYITGQIIRADGGYI